MVLLSGKNHRTSASSWIRLATLGLIFSIALQAVSCESEPTESQCRPYIEKALKQQFSEAEEKIDTEKPTGSYISTDQEQNIATDELTETIEQSGDEDSEIKELREEGDAAETKEHETENNDEYETKGEVEIDESGNVNADVEIEELQEGQDTEQHVEAEGDETEDEQAEKDSEAESEHLEESEEGKLEEGEEEKVEEGEEGKVEEGEEGKVEEGEGGKVEEDEEGKVEEGEGGKVEEGEEGKVEEGEEGKVEEGEEGKVEEGEGGKVEEGEEGKVEEGEERKVEEESDSEITEHYGVEDEETETTERDQELEMTEEEENKREDEAQEEAKETEQVQDEKQGEHGESLADQEEEPTGKEEETRDEAVEDEENLETGKSSESADEVKEKMDIEIKEESDGEGIEETTESQTEPKETTEVREEVKIEIEIVEKSQTKKSVDKEVVGVDTVEQPESEGAQPSAGEQELTPEEDLIQEVIIPENLRPRDHITKILKLDEDSVETESVLSKAIDSTLKNLKTLYDNAIKPLEMLYKYRDLSNRHFGDPEIFSKPLILFMGPWSGGKSSTINYLLDNEYSRTSLRTGAEPSPAYFNILMYGKEEEILDGTQLAADWTFSGLQKFGQGLLDRLKGFKLPSRLLEKVNIVEIPGILEIRKQVQRLFPFNDACQWFIDRADIIFLVYDPSKLDVGPETEAILDQLKGREYQTRIILNKADQVKPEELMRVQGTLIWNISPLMSSTEPPIMYTTSLWSIPYEIGAPTRLLMAQERAFLRDLREAIDKRVENKIAGARRFAVRVRNHAKMVDCYLTTYYNHKTLFGNRKKISDDIIENPQKYHIYEGLSTLTNISRYDLPDPDVYRDFFKINPLYDFTKLSDTCTYFRGCPINKLDVAIAYDLPELVGKYKKVVEASRAQVSQKTNS